MLVDADVTVGAGATITATIGQAVARAEDAVIPSRLFAERGIPRRTANVTYRLLKFAFFDAPQEQLLLVVNHEVFGHGARLRERFGGPIGYRIHAPPPYGDGGASTSFVFDREPTPHEMLAINAGGMEADAVAAALVAHRAFSEGRMHPRDALRYLAFELDTLSYVLGTDDEGEEPGHDVAGFVETYNDVAAAAHVPVLTARSLRREVLAGLANPMLAYAVYGIGRYLWSGATDAGIPALSVAGVRYLPMIRYRLAPYGREWSLVNELGGRIAPMQVELRVGRAPRATPWAVGVRGQQLTTWTGWGLDASVEVWRQPRLAGVSGGPAASGSLGAQVRVRTGRPLVPVWFSAQRATVIVDVGVKTAGFVPGEPLDGGVVARAGVGLPLGR